VLKKENLTARKPKDARVGANQNLEEFLTWRPGGFLTFNAFSAARYALPIAFCHAGRSLAFVHQALTCGYFANVAFTGVIIAYST
jgi:hypothetical protein